MKLYLWRKKMQFHPQKVSHKVILCFKSLLQMYFWCCLRVNTHLKATLMFSLFLAVFIWSSQIKKAETIVLCRITMLLSLRALFCLISEFCGYCLVK